MTRIINWLFGCLHSRTTRPMTLRGESVPGMTCLKCGYRWQVPLMHPDFDEAAAKRFGHRRAVVVEEVRMR